MKKISTRLRIALGLVSLMASVLFLAQMLKFVPDTKEQALRNRAYTSETIAIHCSTWAGVGNLDQVSASLEAIVDRNPDLLTAAVRRSDGSTPVLIGNHAEIWSINSEKRPSSQVHVPIRAGGESWGGIELCFTPISDNSTWMMVLTSDYVQFVFFSVATSALAFYFYLGRVLSQLDPGKVVPKRVRSALDTLTGGLMLLDTRARIMLANQAFADVVGADPSDLQGRSAISLNWIDSEGKPLTEYPWTNALQNGNQRIGVMMSLDVGDDHPRSFLVNASPVHSDQGQLRGALVSFDDVTALEQKKNELTKMLNMLKSSREEIRRQNEELQILATQDPLTGCYNRRAFFQQFDENWFIAKKQKTPIACMMVDIDHFKLINDNFGHHTGDLVLKKVGEVLRENAQKSFFVCRYGGEEFCILMPGLSMEKAVEAAEYYRLQLAAAEFPELSITASLGVSDFTMAPTDPQDLINQADKCLYVAKRNGRNCVISYDTVPEDLEVDETKISRIKEEEDMPIPFHAVTALISALAYRDIATAEHSRRVADLCVAVANKVMNSRDVYQMEIAALLHDIGKIGVPDAILLKPGQLTKEEWKLMRANERIGVEIVKSTFGCDRLAEIIGTHNAWYSGNRNTPNMPTGDDIPLASRILSMADAYDAMTTDKVYKEGLSQEEAFAELRRCAGSQFDPNLVEPFIESLTERDPGRHIDANDLSKRAALRIGLEIENLAEALDNHDIDGLTALAGRLKGIAEKANVPKIAELACLIEYQTSNDPDLEALIAITAELLDLCRMTQRAFLQDARAIRSNAMLNIMQ
ncbi:MAG: diguanylate cyclase (GGDEF)-like protein/PAS domain S-box-containing protein [Pirellulaceae bacterium]